MPGNNQFSDLVKSPFKFRLYLLSKLPAAFFSGIKIKKFTPEEATTVVPFKWLTQNPFRSTYFASLAMAAEMSTGLLALNNIYQKKPAVSMLVTKMEANYFKKAVGKTYFNCNQGLDIKDAVQQALDNPDGSTVTIKSTGRNEQGEIVALFLFTWSFRRKSL
ncbi:MAG: DUF4442 domain-containing protein [Ginsengibacter sp.]|jgi:hypothetical protein